MKLLSESDMANYLRMFVLVVIMFIFFGGSRLYAETSEKQSSFYVTQHGDDENPGTKALPWRTLKPVNQHTFNPGDTVLFSRGSSFNGALHISGSGGNRQTHYIHRVWYRPGAKIY